MMKSHVNDIDTSDFKKLHAFVEKYLPPKELEKKRYTTHEHGLSCMS